MDVRLSAEQTALRDSVAQVVGNLAATAVGQLDDAERAAKLDAAVTAAGWRELRSSTDDGSPWASGVEVGVVAEQLGRGLADVSFVGPTIAAELRRLAGAPAATTAETVVLDAGLTAVAVTDDERAPSGAIAVDADRAAAALLLSADGSLAVVQVRDSRHQVDLTRPAAIVGGASVASVDGQQRQLDRDDLDRVTALGLATACADLVGTMRGAVDLACGYVTDRRQYGRPVGSFQALQHLLADAYVLTEGARSVALHATWAVDALAPADAVTAGSVAKAYAGRAARDVSEAAIQAHGGIGNTWECLAHVHLRRALLSTELFGGVEASLARVAAAHIGADHGLR